jgi:hypothetical protein
VSAFDYMYHIRGRTHGEGRLTSPRSSLAVWTRCRSALYCHGVNQLLVGSSKLQLQVAYDQSSWLDSLSDLRELGLESVILC